MAQGRCGHPSAGVCPAAHAPSQPDLQPQFQRDVPSGAGDAGLGDGWAGLAPSERPPQGSGQGQATHPPRPHPYANSPPGRLAHSQPERSSQVSTARTVKELAFFSSEIKVIHFVPEA